LRIRDVNPGSRILIFDFEQSRIPDVGFWIPYPKTATKENGEKNLLGRAGKVGSRRWRSKGAKLEGENKRDGD
jgi:hypothetical protein